MYHGRYRQGDLCWLSVQCRTGLHVAVVPPAAPLLTIYDAAGAVLLRAAAAVVDRYRQTGTFAYRLFLGSTFPAGQYRVTFQYSDGAAVRLKVGTFEVTAGHPDGAVLSMTAYERPHASFLVHLCESGLRVLGRNPSVS